MAASSISVPIIGTLAYLVDDTKYVRSTNMATSELATQTGGACPAGLSINGAYMLAAIPSFTFTNLTV